MTFLSANITATQTLIPVDAGLTNGTFQYPLHFTVDSEALRVVGRAHETTWLVERGIAGTTAATHSSAATLTRYYPDGATGAGGSLTVDNQSDPPAAVTTLIAPGATIAGDEATLSATNVTATGADNADAQLNAVAEGSGHAFANSAATTDGAGLADASIFALANGDGTANAGPEAQTNGTGTAFADCKAEALGTGNANVRATAETVSGTASAAALAIRDTAKAGMEAVVDGTSARMAFNGTTPIAKPTGVAVTAEAIHAALVSLGLIAGP